MREKGREWLRKNDETRERIDSEKSIKARTKEGRQEQQETQKTTPQKEKVIDHSKHRKLTNKNQRDRGTTVDKNKVK